MKEIIKTFVEATYPGHLYSLKRNYQVENRNPNNILNDGTIQSFRFYDRKYYIDGNKEYIGNKFNYSKEILFGQKIKVEDIDEEKYQCIKIYLMKRNIEYVCITNNETIIPIANNQITYEEYVNEYNNIKKYELKYKSDLL